MDERRVKFLPEYMEYPHKGQADDNRVKEVWFTGTHSDIAGGNIRNIDLNRGTESLAWMMDEAEQAGLKVAPLGLNQLAEQTHVTTSLSLPWWILEFLPLNRRDDKFNGARTTRWPHLGRGRRISEHHKIHYSVLDNLLQGASKSYRPRATFKQWNLIFDDAASQRGTRWEGNADAVRMLRTVDNEIEMAQKNHNSQPWLDNVIERLRDGEYDSLAHSGHISTTHCIRYIGYNILGAWWFTLSVETCQVQGRGTGAAHHRSDTGHAQ
ncbi:hypothetical protein FS749_007047 [Ceratobasidium sp. UAMH 11750]|nr:hypothetical protein FS749_007047 [Ceratobasidium sp. UAMH 11750]